MTFVNQLIISSLFLLSCSVLFAEGVSQKDKVTNQNIPIWSEPPKKIPIQIPQPQRPTPQVKKKSAPRKLISIDEFKRLKMRLEKYNAMDEQEKRTRILLEESKANYAYARANFAYVLELKKLVKDIELNQDCYIKYYRIRDLNNKLKSIPEGQDTKILLKVKKPLEEFLKNCKSLRFDLLKKYEDNKQ